MLAQKLGERSSAIWAGITLLILLIAVSQTETSWAFNEQQQNKQQACGGLNQEAETAALFGGMQVGSDGNASGGKYIYVPSSYGEEIYEVKPEHRAELCVDIQSAGKYRITGWVQSSNNNSDSLYVYLDGSISNSYLWDTRENSQFVSDEINNRGVSDPQVFELTQGQHTLTFVHREPNTKLDRIEFVQVSVATPNPQAPTNTPIPAVTATQTSVPPTATATASTTAATATTAPTQLPPTQTATATNTSGGGSAVCGGLTQEAELGTLFGNMTTGFSTGASNGQFIYIPNNFSSTGSLNTAHRADYCIDIQVAGEYKINTWVNAPNNTSDSFFVTVDDLPAGGYLWDVSRNGGFITDFVNNRRKADPQIVYLSKGQHTLTFSHRESGTLLDKFELVLHSSNGGNPPATATTVPPAPTSTTAAATATSISPTATTIAATATATADPGQGSPICGGLAQEAELGTLFGNMTVGTDGSASNGKYVYIPNSFRDRGNFDNTDRADFCVTVPAAGEYTIQAWVKAPDIYSDSFFITVNGLPSGGYLWDAKKSGSFLSDFISNRSKDDPQTVYLAAGQHTVSFVQRETGTLLDKFELIASSGNGAPVPTSPAPTSVAPTEVAPTATSVPPQATATPISNNNGDVYFVSRNGNNGDGRSWGSAWNELGEINWNILQPGDTVYIDGGSNSMTYRTTLKPAKSGTSGNPILLQLSAENGRNGQAVLFGGNSVLLPECGQRSWNESQWNSAGDNAILFENGVAHVTIDGRKRQGITVHGWKADGIKFVSDRINNGRDDNTKNITLRYMEIYNNGNIRRQSDGSSSNLYYPDHASSGIELSGVGHKFEFMEIHDNASDAIQSGYTNPSGGVYNNMDDFTLTNSWLYNMRPHSGQDNSPSGETCSLNSQGGCDELGAPHMSLDYQYYPSTPSNRVESFNWCTHSDGIQIFSSNDFNKMTIQRTIIGPNFMTGLILGDRNGSNASAWVNDLTLEDVVITRFMHNALGMKNPSNNAGKNWNLKNVTIYGHYNNTNKGTLNLDSNASSPEHTIEDSIMVFGRTNFPNGNIIFRNNCESNMYSGSINGAQVDPQFSNILNRDVFESNINADFANVFTDNYTAGASQCSGSEMTSTSDLLSRFNRN